jgi:hypothetical protein
MGRQEHCESVADTVLAQKTLNSLAPNKAVINTLHEQNQEDTATLMYKARTVSYVAARCLTGLPASQPAKGMTRDVSTCRNACTQTHAAHIWCANVCQCAAC